MAYRTLNPFTEERIEDYPEHTDAQVEAALAKADGLFRSDWSRGDIAPRLAVLTKLSGLLTEHQDRLARTIAEEMGKPLAQGTGEIELCAGIAAYYAERAEEFLKPKTIDSDLGEAWTEFHPIGVLLAVEPWNFPIYQLIRVVAPAIAVGNPILFKHAGIVPRCAALFEDLCRQAGAPRRLRDQSLHLVRQGGRADRRRSHSGRLPDRIGRRRVQGCVQGGGKTEKVDA